MLLGSSLCLVCVVLIHALRLGQFVYFTANEAGEEFLGELVRDLLAFLALVVFVEFHAFKGGTASDQFVGELGLIVVAAGPVDLLVGVAGIVWEGLVG